MGPPGTALLPGVRRSWALGPQSWRLPRGPAWPCDLPPWRLVTCPCTASSLASCSEEKLSYSSSE